jgi:2-dehydropantoate 2-reductase
MAASSERVLVVGCGSIGGNLGAGLSGHVPALVALSTNPTIAEAVNRHGYRLGARAAPGRVVASLEGEAPFDFVLLATQPPQVEAAAREVAPWLAPDGAMVVLQNGLCEERIGRIVGTDRVLGAIVAWGASMTEPGVYRRTSRGGFVLGRADGAEDPRLVRLAELLAPVGPATITRNLAGARWSKLAMNCAISTLGTIGGDRLGALLRYRYARRLGLLLMSEVVAVARAEGVRLEKLSGTIDLDWLALTPAEHAARGSWSLVAKHALLLAVGMRYRNLRSSMLAAIERGRPPAVDFLNGEIAERGRHHGIPTPVNTAATALVHAIARRDTRSGLDTLRDLERHAEG